MTAPASSPHLPSPLYQGQFRLLSQNGYTPALATSDGAVYTDSEVILHFADDIRVDKQGAASIFAAGNEDLARAISPIWDTMQVHALSICPSLSHVITPWRR